MKAYSYLRVSGKSQIDGDGFPRQRTAIDAWACLNGAEIVQEFVEEGISGDDEWQDRPAFQDMVDKVLGNGVRTIVVENLGRLARSYVVQELILIWFASKDIDLITADTGANITAEIKQDPMKKLIVQIQGILYEFEKASLVRKLRAARKRKKDAGHRVDGRKPFGHRNGEPEAIQRMITLREKGLSYQDIATALDEEGFPTRVGRRKKGKTWAGESVRRILLREMEVAK